GIRARAAEVLRYIERESPDVLCLQEIKASPEDVPAPICDLGDYWCLWHGFKGYSGVSLHLRKATFPGRPRFTHPEFDQETRIVTARLGELLLASVYVPNGARDLPAKIRFLEGLEKFAAMAQPARAEHRLAHRLRARQLIARGKSNFLRRCPRVRHERSRSPAGRVRGARSAVRGCSGAAEQACSTTTRTDSAALANRTRT